MGLLPCLRRGSDRWWLPLSETATEAIAQLMLAAGRGDEFQPSLQRRLHDAVCVDPSLMIYAGAVLQRTTGDHVGDL